MSACVVVTESDMLRAGTMFTVTRIRAAEIGRCVRVCMCMCCMVVYIQHV